ncbi:MAG TPA: hypothetical protein VHP80_01330 [Candidatus Acidoferrum sp.]|nr:hypothetical protein [Candidatus Acidoferrum sp.]
MQISHNNSQFVGLNSRKSHARIGDGQQFQYFMQAFMPSIDYK